MEHHDLEKHWQSFQFVTDDWKITQNLIRVQMLSKSLCGEELARELIVFYR